MSLRSSVAILLEAKIDVGGDFSPADLKSRVPAGNKKSSNHEVQTPLKLMRKIKKHVYFGEMEHDDYVVARGDFGPESAAGMFR